ncbi:MAG: hypothetical protein OCD02_12275 [Spirochaetaceae bacterium]
MAKKQKPLSAKQQVMMNELQKVQEQMIKQLIKRLSGKDKKILAEFLQSQKAPGSKEYNALPKIVQGVVLKMNLKNLDIMRKHTKNPFTILRLKFSAWTFRKLGDADPKAAKKKKKKKKK